MVHPVVTFQNVVTIVNDTGERADRRRHNTIRVFALKKSLELMTRWRRAIHRDVPENVAASSCAICCYGGSLDATEDGAIWLACANCMYVYHKDCIDNPDSFASTIPAGLLPEAELPVPTSFPHGFSDAVCKFCRAAWRWPSR